MSTIQAGDEISVKVRIDGKVALQDMDKLNEETTKKMSGLTKGIIGGLTSAMSMLYGGIANQARSAMQGTLDAYGRGTLVGQVANRFWGEQNARLSAQERTVQTLGFAGANASREQILGLYNMYKAIDTQYARGRANVESVVGENMLQKDMAQTLKDIKYGITHIPQVLKELGRILGY